MPMSFGSQGNNLAGNAFLGGNVFTGPSSIFGNQGFGAQSASSQNPGFSAPSPVGNIFNQGKPTGEPGNGGDVGDFGGGNPFQGGFGLPGFGAGGDAGTSGILRLLRSLSPLNLQQTLSSIGRR